MDDQFYPALISGRTYFLQEEDEVAPQLSGINTVIPCQSLPELVNGKTFLAPGQTGNDVSRKKSGLFRIHSPETGFRPFLLLIGIFVLSPFAPEDIQVESHEGIPFETQGPGPVGQLIGKVGPRPVEHWHEIVGDTSDTALRKVTQCLPVVVNIPHEITGPGLDMLMYRNTFHHAPHKA